MERIRKHLKFAAFVPAFLLIGAFIGCRTGAFPMFSKPEPKSEPSPVNPPAANPPAPEGKPLFMGGSKSPNLPAIKSGLAPASEQTAVPPTTPNAPTP